MAAQRHYKIFLHLFLGAFATISFLHGSPWARSHREPSAATARGDVAESSPISPALGRMPQMTIEEGLPRFVAWFSDYHGP